MTSYDEALKRVKAAEFTSDVSACETDDRRTRHERCKKVQSADEEHVSATSKRTDKTLCIDTALPPVPAGLQANTLSSSNFGM